MIQARLSKAREPSSSSRFGPSAILSGILCVAACSVENIAWREHSLPAWALAVLVGASVGVGLFAITWPIRSSRLLAAALLLPMPIISLRDLVLEAHRAIELWSELAHVAVRAMAVILGCAVSASLHRFYLKRALADQARWRWFIELLVALVTSLVFVGLMERERQIVGVATILVAVFAVPASCLYVRFQPALGALLFVAATALVTFVLPERYLELQSILGTWVVGGAVLCARGLAVRANAGRSSAVAALVAAALALAMAVGAHVVVVGAGNAWSDRRRVAGVSSSLVRLAQRATDFDQDGAGIVFGQEDCAPFDAAITVEAHEIPGNGRDDNCSGGDARGEARDWHRERDAVNGIPPSWTGSMVLVTIDALRYDDSMAANLEALRALRAEGLSFERAYTSSTFTMHALAGLLAARLPTSMEFEWVTKLQVLPRRPPGGLVPALSALGYDTAIVGGYSLQESSYFRRGSLGAGARLLAPTPYHASPAEVGRAAAQAWHQLDPGRPRFLWVHFMAAHAACSIRPRYLKALENIDRAVGELRGAVGDDPLWIVAADHGEAFGDHGFRGHAHSLYSEVIHVPLIFAGRVIKQGTSARVSPTRALMPTLIAMARSPSVPEGAGPYLCLGQSPCNDMEVPMMLEMPNLHLHGLVVGHRQIVRDVTRRHLAAYDLDRDPRELHPLAHVPGGLLRELEAWEEHGMTLLDDSQVWPYSGGAARPAPPSAATSASTTRR
jgi:hypothetical protein